MRRRLGEAALDRSARTPISSSRCSIRPTRARRRGIARGRARCCDAQLHALSPVTDAWRRLASRHIATALLLEQQQQVEPDDPVARRRRFFRHD
jgi:hypothetical protein